jgi:hypothetical protein
MITKLAHNIASELRTTKNKKILYYILVAMITRLFQIYRSYSLHSYWFLKTLLVYILCIYDYCTPYEVKKFSSKETRKKYSYFWQLFSVWRQKTRISIFPRDYSLAWTYNILYSFCLCGLSFWLADFHDMCDLFEIIENRKFSTCTLKR